VEGWRGRKEANMQVLNVFTRSQKYIMILIHEGKEYVKESRM
jgi:hypothetical protein